MGPQAFWGPLLGFGAPRGCSSQFRLGKCRWNEQTHGRKNEGMNEAVPLPSTAGLAQEDGGGRGASGKIRPRTARAWPRMPRTPRRWWGLLLNLAGRAKNILLKLLEICRGLALPPDGCLLLLPRRLLASATLASWSPVLNTPGPVPASGPSHLLLPLPGMLFLTCKELRVSLPYFLQVSAQMSLSQGGEP